MTIIQAIILGVVEGLTEFLPISSTGHLILANRLLGVAESDFNVSFSIAIQLGAILAVVALYWKRVWTDKEMWKHVTIAFIPTAILGFGLYKIIKKFLLANSLVVVWSLLLGGVALIIFEWWYKKTKRSASSTEQISYQKSLALGMAQSIAMIPGVSRAAATIVGGLLMGVSRAAIVEFSFLLAVPTMAAATGYDLLKNAGNFSFSQLHLLLIGGAVSFAVALISIKWLLRFIKNHTFTAFGVYRIIVAILFWLFVSR